MSQKLESALNRLQQSVEKFEESFVANETVRAKQASQKTSSNKPALDQNDLFGLSQNSPQEGGGNENAKAMTAVLDRTIHRMEKLVGENA